MIAFMILTLSWENTVVLKVFFDKLVRILSLVTFTISFSLVVLNLFALLYFTSVNVFEVDSLSLWTEGVPLIEYFLLQLLDQLTRNPCQNRLFCRKIRINAYKSYNGNWARSYLTKNNVEWARTGQMYSEDKRRIYGLPGYAADLFWELN